MFSAPAPERERSGIDSVWVYAIAFLAVGVASWQYWLHVVLFDHVAPMAEHLSHLIRDSALMVIPAAGAVAIACWVQRRWSQVGWPSAPVVAAALGVLLLPSVVLHGLVDDVFRIDPLADLAAAPGAGYLLQDTGEHAAHGVAGYAAHSLRDALLSVPMSLLLWLLAGAFVRLRSPAVVESRPRIPADDIVPGAVSRRQFLKYGGAGAAVMTLGSGGLLTLSGGRAHAAAQGSVTPWLTDDIQLFINDGTVSMIDGVPVYMWGYGLRSGSLDDSDALHTPGPVLWTDHGQSVTVTVTNTLDEPHSFFIDGVVDSGPISPGDSAVVTFAAPTPGTYLYQDGLNRPVNRVMGLHGVLIVMPADGSYRAHPALDASHWTFASQWVWVFNEIDPTFNAKVHGGLVIDPDDLVADFTPRYFLLNGRMGSLAAHQETAADTVVHGGLGNAALIRVVAAGVAVHAPHFHGNHVYPLLRNGSIEQPIMWKDTIHLMPEDRVDVHLPYLIPPNAVHFPPPQSGRDFLRELHGHDIEGTWPMHCHIEMSQTAGGGLYPQGQLTDWKMEL
jgi:hypothetical protein